MWNSARRNPRAIENMVAKYAETGDMSGAGGMIGYLVWSHQQAAESSTAYYDALQAAITDGDLSVETAERLLDGSLSQDSFDMALDVLGDDVVFEDGVISCAAEAVCDAEELAALQEDADALAFLASDEAADLRTAQEDYDAAREDVEAADALVQPNKSTDEEVREQMLADVKDLLDIDEITAPAFVAPDIEEEDTGDSDEDA
jgi:acetone carboxylase gamma subunit